MTTRRFRPLDLPDDQVEEFFALTEGIERDLRSLLISWVMENAGDGNFVSGKYLAFFSAASRSGLTIESDSSYSRRRLESVLGRNSVLLNFIQYVLMEPDDLELEALDMTLLHAHSVWTVAPHPEGGAGLERRVPAGVDEAVRHTASRAGVAGQKLKSAWNSAYGLHEDASSAYSNAIKAVETLACPLIEENRALPTLGTTYRALRDQHGGKKTNWTFKISETADSDPVTTVVSMMQTLWHGQRDRHGGDESKTRAVTIEEARAAVLLAATLVGWLNDGYLAKK